MHRSRLLLPSCPLLTMLAAVSASCVVEPPSEAIELALDMAPPPAEALAGWGVDNDNDGIDDGVEWELANRFAPVLYLPFSYDWTRPASVDWYLARVHMRMHHNNCSDCGIIGLGSVTQSNMIQQQHRRKTLKWYGCSHEDPYQYSNGSWHKDDHFFLQAPNDSTHNGTMDTSQWKVYVHAYPNTIGGINIQYWYFWPYNDGPSGQNHEGDWEHINVRLNASYTVDTVYFSYHGNIAAYAPSDVQWYDGTHPYVWISDGSHASYRSENVCNWHAQEQGFSWPSCQTTSAYRWFTWAGGKGAQAGYQGGGLVNVGEKETPLNGQTFIQYSGRWGELGVICSLGTCGPQGPAYQSAWNLDRGAISGSCAGQCGGAAGSCWCDSACVSFGDCCPNACAACGYC